MKTAFFPPVEDLNLNVGSMKIVFADRAAENALYKSYAADKSDGRYTIMDFCEPHKTEDSTHEEFADMIDVLNPDEIVLPYWLEDKNLTERAALDFYNDFIVGKRNPPKIMAVAQGHDVKTWLESYSMWQNLDFIDIVGIRNDIDFLVGTDSRHEPESKTLTSRAVNRVRLIAETSKVDRNKPIHLLGMNTLGEINAISETAHNRPGFVRSVSTDLPFTAAKNNVDWENSSRDQHFDNFMPVAQFDSSWTKKQKVLAYKNLMAVAIATRDHAVSYNLGRLFDQDEILQGE